MGILLLGEIIQGAAPLTKIDSANLSKEKKCQINIIVTSRRGKNTILTFHQNSFWLDYGNKSAKSFLNN